MKIAWLLALCLACGQPADPSSPGEAGTKAPWPADEGWGTLSLEGSYWVCLLPQGEAVVDGALPLNEDFAVEVRVFDGATRTRRVDGVELRVDARMPVHGHGMKQDARTEREDDGSWRASPLLLHMSGPWELYVDVTRGAITERAQYRIVLE